MAEAAIPASGRFYLPSEYRLAVDRLVGAARHLLCIFDRDLAGAGFEAPARAESLRRFLLASRDSRLLIVLHDVRPLEREQPRLINLLRQFPHAVEIRETGPEARGVTDTLMIADDAHCVRRFHFDHPRGEWILNDLRACQPLRRRFDEIWLASTVAVTPTVLGL